MFEEFDFQEPAPKYLKTGWNDPIDRKKKIPSPVNEYWVPKFLDSDSFSQPEYRNEWKCYIANQNIKQISDFENQENRGIRFMFYGVKIVECIFILCGLLKQPPEVKYLAIDILDRFLILHFFQTADNAEKLGKNKLEWEYIVDRIFNQALLRMLSTIQLAAKYSCNSKEISVTSVQNLMNKLGHCRCTKDTILKSEARVYQTLNFSIPMVSPLTFIEMFFEDFASLREELNLSVSLQEFFNVSMDVLDVAIAYHKEIYDGLWCKVKGRLDQTLAEKSKFLSTEGDYMYLASGVIRAAATVEDPSNGFAERITNFIYSTTQYKTPEIEVLSSLIIEIILRD